MEQNLSTYRIFYVTATEKNISRAAKKLYISQPAVSKAITKLELNLGTMLFKRSHKGVTLTAEGQILYEKIALAFTYINDAEKQLKKINELGMGQIRFGVSTTLCKYVLLPYLRNFIRENPHIRISVVCQSTFQTIKLLEEEKIDIGLIGKPDIDKEYLKKLSFRSLGDIEDVFVTTKAYLDNLKQRESETDLNHIYESSTFILLDKENMTRQYIDHAFLEHHIEPDQIIEVTTMDLLIDFVKTGLGIACVIKDFVKEDIENGTLIQVPFQPAIPKRTIGFAYTNHLSVTDATQKFIDFIKTSDKPLSAL